MYFVLFSQHNRLPPLPRPTSSDSHLPLEIPFSQIYVCWCPHVCMFTTCVPVPQRLEAGIRCPEAGVTDGITRVLETEPFGRATIFPVFPPPPLPHPSPPTLSPPSSPTPLSSHAGSHDCCVFRTPSMSHPEDGTPLRPLPQPLLPTISSTFFPKVPWALWWVMLMPCWGKAFSSFLSSVL